jgi:beta-lactam-binding protein with PASTA domain
VPNVVGLTQTAATTAITGAGLTVGTVTTQSSTTVPAGSVINQSPVGGTQVNLGSAVALIVSSGAPLVSVPDVVGLSQSEATTAITDAGLTVGAVTTASSATVPAGSVISETPAAGTTLPVGGVVALVVSSGPASTVPFAVERIVFSDGGGTRTTPAFSTFNPNDLIVAFVAAGGPSNLASKQTVTVSGAGLTWTLVIRENDQFGTAEVWSATAAAPLTNATVSSTPSISGFLQSLTVVAFSGAGGTGATGSNSAATGPSIVPLTTTSAGAFVYGVGYDSARNQSRTLGPNQVMVHQFTTGSGSNNTFWTQALNGAVSNAGTRVTINDTAPTNGRWNMSAVEIVPAAPPPVMATVPDVFGLTQAAATSAIADAGLAVGTISTAPNAAVPAGLVFEQAPDAGAQVRAGGSVSLVISSGAPQVSVPDVVGVPQNTAIAEIVGADLVATVTMTPSSTVAAGFVISQAPGSGAQVDAGSTVVLTVSSGPAQVPVPNVVGLTQDAATTAILGASLSIGTVTTTPSSTVPPGSVISQSPVAGTQANSGSAVALVVSLGPAKLAVPNVVGLAQAAATSAITTATLTVGTVTTASSSTVPFGSVISQTPVAGTQVDPGSAVALVVSSGPALVAVPNVVGMTQAAATSVITTATLTIGTVTTASSTTVPAGSVIAQSPEADTQVTVGTVVSLVVSSGPPQVSVPNVVGLTQPSATSAITSATLTVGTVTTASSSTVPAGSVISQTPAAGTQAISGSAVSLVVSSGPPKVAVPNVVGLTQAAATSAITGATLTVGTVTTASSSTVPAGSVISQTPAAATQATSGSAVSLVVSSGPPQVAVPNVVGLTQTAATSAITAATLTVGGVTTAASSTVPSGSVISQTPAAGTQAAAGSAVALVVSSGAPLSVPLSMESKIFADGAGVRTTAPFSVASAGDLVVAFVSAGGPTALSSKQTVTVTGGGLTWQLATRANAQFGTAEIWTAIAPTALSNITVTSTPAIAGWEQSLNVVVFAGSSGTGATAVASADTGATTVSLTTTKAGSFVYGVAYDSARSTARTLPANQMMIHQMLGQNGASQTYWVQSLINPVLIGGTRATINITSPTSDRWNVAAIEILAAPVQFIQ